MFYVNVPRRPVAVRQSLASLLNDPLFDSVFTHSRRAQAAAAQPVAAQPALDVAESQGAYTATIDLPGIGRDEVKVSIDGRKVTVVAETKAQPQAAAAADASASPVTAGETAAATASVPATANANAAAEPSAPAVAEADAIRVVWRERATRRFSRTFTLPVVIDEAASSAKLDNGVLTLTLAKKAEPVAAQLTVQ